MAKLEVTVPCVVAAIETLSDISGCNWTLLYDQSLQQYRVEAVAVSRGGDVYVSPWTTDLGALLLSLRDKLASINAVVTDEEIDRATGQIA